MNNIVRSDSMRTLDEIRPAVAVVLGRSGSKGLPGKNMIEVGGRPMIAHSIEHALAARFVTEVYCSTDGLEIAEAAEIAGATVVMRPVELADEKATVDSAVRHTIESIANDSEVVVILYGNIPIRPEGLIDRAIQRLIETGADSVQSYAPVGKHHPYWITRLDAEDRVTAWQENTVYRRQDLPEVFIPDGGVIAVKRACLFRVDPDYPHAFLGEDRRGIRNEHGAVIDVDDEVDLRVVEAIFGAYAPAGDVR
jgi:N-acylneuraminate cytidylyltransferase